MRKLIVNDTCETINNVLNFYYKSCDEKYIPAILTSGSLYKDGEDFYVKLIIAEKNTSINKSWFLSNFVDYEMDGAFNVIIETQYKYKSIYNINHMLQGYSTSYVEQKSKDIFDIEYIGSEKKINYDKAIKCQDGKNVYVLRVLISNYIGDEKYTDYQLYLEIELRAYYDGLNPTMVGEQSYNNGFIDLSYENRPDLMNEKSKDKYYYWLRATVPLGIKETIKTNTKKTNSILRVFDIETHKMRHLNPSNYDDDMHAGLIVYKKEAVQIIKKYYYFYGLHLIPRDKKQSECLVDELDNYVVFWEGEYNSNLTSEVKKEIEIFNIKDVDAKGIISPAMFDSQLMGKWDIDDKLLPNQHLAKIVLAKYKNAALEKELDFSNPITLEDYSSFIVKLLSVIKRDIGNLNLQEKYKDKLNTIIEKRATFNDYQQLLNDYRGFCYYILQLLKNE